MGTSKLNLGNLIPAFNLPATDGQFYSQDMFKDKKGIVIVFSCNHCPYVQAYEERLINLQKQYEGTIQFAAINSNDEVNYPDDSFEQMKVRMELKKFNYPYLRDEDQTVAASFGATHTPEIFLFNKEGALVFHGKIDDNWQEEDRVKSRYLKNAIDEMLNEVEISVPETFTIGCTIKWKR